MLGRMFRALDTAVDTLEGKEPALNGAAARTAVVSLISIFSQWILVALLIYLALPAALSSVAGGLLILAGAALAAPPIWAALSSRTSFRHRRPAIVLLPWLAWSSG